MRERLTRPGTVDALILPVYTRGLALEEDKGLMSPIKESLDDKRLLCRALFATSPKTTELVSDKQGL